MDVGVWKTTIHEAAKSQTQLSNFHFYNFKLKKLCISDLTLVISSNGSHNKIIFLSK